MLQPTTLDAGQQRNFFGIMALLFLVSATVTVVWCSSMSPLCGMPMPGGWTMSMMWMRMPGQTWQSAASTFIGMWIVMMVAMMLPSITPTLWHYHEAFAKARPTRATQLTATVAAGYFSTWALLGLALFPVGVALSTLAMQSTVLARTVPLVEGMTILLAGILQFSTWKNRHLACCRKLPDRHSAAALDAGSAWLQGLNLGAHCIFCCANLTLILLVVGVMDLHVMAIVTSAITLERLTPKGQRTARIIGVVVVAAGLLLIANELKFV